MHNFKMARSSLVMMSLVWVYNFGTAEIMFELDMYRSYPAPKIQNDYVSTWNYL